MEVLEQGAIAGAQTWAATAGAADAHGLGVGLLAGIGPGVEFGEATVDGGARESSGGGDE